MAGGLAVAVAAALSSVSLPGSISYVTSIAPIAVSMGVPVAPLALLVAVETFPDIFRTIGNVVADVADRKSVVEGKRGSVRVDLGGRRIRKKEKSMQKTM